MKGLIAALFAGASVAGCVVVPVEPVPARVYIAPPPPAVVVRPYVHYHYRSHDRYRRWR